MANQGDDPKRKSAHAELHRTERVPWLRAAVLGANDGIVSTASLLVGVAAAGASSSALFLTGVAATVAGAMSMAAGEYVSVRSQADAERADMKMERRELERNPEFELKELQAIYEERGLDAPLAHQVAVALTEKDALQAHARDELGLTEIGRARPLLAAVSSASAFVVGALLPVVSVALAPAAFALWAIIVTALVTLGLLGLLSAFAGGAPLLRPTLRVLFWGGLAMGATYAVGALFGVRLT